MSMFWQFVSSYLIIALFLLGLSAARRRFGWFVLAAGASWIINTILKYVIDRPRPFEAGDAVASAELLVSTPSFPSGHAAAAFAMAAFVFGMNRRWGVFLVALAVLVAASRVIVGVHYVSDVVAGAALGIAVGWGAYRWGKRL